MFDNPIKQQWDNKKITPQEIMNWLRSSWPEAKEVEGPVKVFRSNDWGITALYKLHMKDGVEQNIVCKVGFLKIFETSVDIYNLIKESCPDSVPELIKGEYRDEKAWLQFKVFNGRPISEEQKLESLMQISIAMAKIQKSTVDYLKEHNTNVPVIEISSIPVLFQRILDKYMKLWVENYEIIAEQLNMNTHDYKEIFNTFAMNEFRIKLEVLCRELEFDPVARVYSIDHVDLHSGNAAVLKRDKLLIYDWEEAVISCPFFSTDKLLDEAAKLDHEENENSRGIWNRSQCAVKESYLCEFYEGDAGTNVLSRAFDVAMCVAPIKYAYQGTFFLDQVGWLEMAPVLVAESIIKAYKRCSII